MRGLSESGDGGVSRMREMGIPLRVKPVDRWHYDFEIDYLLQQRDVLLIRMMTGGTPDEIRATLQRMKVEGLRYLVVGSCDHKTHDGRCAGHRTHLID
ncbi:hypothetical protein KDW40_01880 [Burkholderia cenocepacia]|nr:hypothetical protein [Burkholderia cenocepacia]MBR8324479.1 hypothetical protein [Burkholderia cenocepacia]